MPRSDSPLPKANAAYTKTLAEIHELTSAPAIDIEDQLNRIDELVGDLYANEIASQADAFTEQAAA